MISANFKDREHHKFIESPTRPNKTAIEISGAVTNVSPFGLFDKIAASYPTATSEVYTYSLSGSVIGTITVDYTDDTKEVFSQAVYSAV